jgi:hypothetical protein
MDKLEAVQKVLRFSASTLKWAESKSMYFGDFDSHNVDDYDSKFGEIADEIIKRGLAEDFLDEDECDFLD